MVTQIDTSETECLDPTLARLRAVAQESQESCRSRVSWSDRCGNAPLTLGEAPQSQDIHVLSLAQETTAVLCCGPTSIPLRGWPQHRAVDPAHSEPHRDAKDWDATSSERSQSTLGPPQASTACLSSWNISPKSTPLPIISICDFYFSPLL